MNILLVEDDLNLINTLNKGFAEEGFSIDTVECLQDAKTYLDMKEYCIIVLDKILPDGDGSKFCLKLRAEGLRTPILLLSACTEQDDIVGGLNNGADDYLKKPFHFPELIARMRALSKRKDNLQSHILKVQDLTINIMSREVKRAEKIIELRNNEFNLLLLLIKRKNNVVSKTEIIDYIWDLNTFIDPNVLNVTIYNLRKKIECIGKQKIIYTVRSIGYKIVE